jgi:hypothetical protein
VLAACIVLNGCGGVKFASVSGKVTYKGKALPDGKVTFWPAQAGGNPATAQIQPDGTYTASVAVGECAVTVETESVAGRPQTGIPGGIPTKGNKSRPGGPPPEVMAQIKESMQAGNAPAEAHKGDYVKIDLKYSRPTTSGIQTTIQSGEQTYDIPLN